MSRIGPLFCIFFLLLLSLSSNPVQAEEPWGEFLPIDEYYTLYKPDGSVLLETGRKVYLEDQFLTADNQLYEVVEIDEESKAAYTSFVEKVELQSFPLQELQRELGLLSVGGTLPDEKKGSIGIYHTHNAESYIPTDGTDSINGKGGIHQVGLVFQETLNELDVDVHYLETLHLPHDRGAYRRSRETVLELLSENPDAIFDIHRDAAPQNAYAVQLGNEWMTSIQFVVGRQNQNLGINRKYAQSLKKIADDLYPGLIKGIFYGRGNYNQDLSPLSLLIEVGAHTNSRPAAERGVRLFAEVVDFYFYGPTAEAASHGPRQAAQRSIFGLIIFITTGALSFFIIKAGGFSPAWERLVSVFKREKLK